MQVQEIMTSDVQCCTPETDLATAAAMMWNHDCGALPVVADGQLAGMITDRDICIAVGTRDRLPRELTVRDAEATEITSCKPTDDVHHAMELMRSAKVRRLPVVDDSGAVQGLLSINDIALRVNRTHGDDLSYEQVLNTIKAVSEHRPQHQAARVSTAAV